MEYFTIDGFKDWIHEAKHKFEGLRSFKKVNLKQSGWTTRNCGYNNVSEIELRLSDVSLFGRIAADYFNKRPLDLRHTCFLDDVSLKNLEELENICKIAIKDNLSVDVHFDRYSSNIIAVSLYEKDKVYAKDELVHAAIPWQLIEQSMKITRMPKKGNLVFFGDYR